MKRLVRKVLDAIAYWIDNRPGQWPCYNRDNHSMNVGRGWS
jgi:hypothetical protein